MSDYPSVSLRHGVSVRYYIRRTGLLKIDCDDFFNHGNFHFISFFFFSHAFLSSFHHVHLIELLICLFAIWILAMRVRQRYFAISNFFTFTYEWNLFILAFDLHLGGPCVALFDSENYGGDSSIEDGKASNLQVECVGICWNLESV